MPTKKLDDRTVKAPLNSLRALSKPPATGRFEVWDTVLPGFGLRVTAGDARTYCVLYRSPTELNDKGGQKQRKLTIGNAKVMDLGDARKLARAALQSVEQGIDPAPEKVTPESVAAAEAAGAKAVAEAAKRTFSAVVARFQTDHIDIHMKPGKSRAEATRIVNKLADRWGAKQLRDIEDSDIIELLDEIQRRGAITMAKNFRRQIKTLFVWCREKGLLKVNGHQAPSPTDHIGKPPKTASRERTLKPEEIGVAFLAYARVRGIYGDVFRMMAFTAQRENEVAGMRWSELTTAGNDPVWHIPGARTKNGRDHILHLSPQALALLRERAAVRPSDADGNPSPFVFPGRDRPMEKHITSFSRPAARVWKAIQAIKAEGNTPEAVFADKFTPHDWRRTFMSLANEQLRLRREVTDKVLNHTTGGVAGIYDRADYLDERREAIMAWGVYVEGLASGKDPAELRRT